MRSSSLISTAESYQSRFADLSQFCQKSAISTSHRAGRIRDFASRDTRPFRPTQSDRHL